MTDAVHRILDIVAQVAPLAEARGQVEALLRRELGGQHLRIAERPPVTLERIDARLRERVPVREIAAEMGCSRFTIYRHLRARPKSARRAP